MQAILEIISNHTVKNKGLVEEAQATAVFIMNTEPDFISI
jgi:hypothetical protein